MKTEGSRGLTPLILNLPLDGGSFTAGKGPPVPINWDALGGHFEEDGIPLPLSGFEHRTIQPRSLVIVPTEQILTG